MKTTDTFPVMALAFAGISFVYSLILMSNAWMMTLAWALASFTAAIITLYQSRHHRSWRPTMLIVMVADILLVVQIWA